MPRIRRFPNKVTESIDIEYERVESSMPAGWVLASIVRCHDSRFEVTAMSHRPVRPWEQWRVVGHGTSIATALAATDRQLRLLGLDEVKPASDRVSANHPAQCCGSVERLPFDGG